MPLNDLFTYKISESGDGSIKAIININAEHSLYGGHFPGQPVTPGIALLEMIRIILSDLLNKDMMLTEAKDIKFLAPVVPPDMQNLDLEITYLNLSEGISTRCILSGNDKVYTKIRGVFSESK